MPDITRTPVTLGDQTVADDIYSATIFANELSRDGISVDIDGMDISNYEKNPVVLFAHDSSGRTESGGLPIGRTIRLERTPDGRLRADFEFLCGDPFAERVRNAWNRGFLRGASIGWRALEAKPLHTGRGVRVVRSELIEWSIVAVPADPDALRSAHSRVMKALIDRTHPIEPANTSIAETAHPELDLSESRKLLESLSRSLSHSAEEGPACRAPPRTDIHPPTTSH